MPVTTGPSGVKLEWREMTFADEDAFAANAGKSEASQAQAFDELLGRLLIGVPDRGPYKAPPANVDSALSGDRMKFLVDVRNDAFGEEMQIKRTCPRGHDIDQIVDLRHLDLEPLPKASAEALSKGLPLSFTLPRCGRTVQWQMLTGHLETAVLEAVTGYPDQSVSEATVVRIVEVDGFDEHGLDEATGEDLRGWLAKLHTRDSRALRQHIANNECGVKTVITIPCKHGNCKQTVEVNVLTEPGFFPLAVQRQESTASSGS